MEHHCITFKKNNFNDLFTRISHYIRVRGEMTNPRNFNCKEIISPQVILTNPRNCLITIKKRKLNYAYLIVEKMMYLTQQTFPDILIAYNNNMKKYLNNDNYFDGSYGERIKLNYQLDWCYNILKKDNDSRQAVITIHNASDCRDTKDNCCTLTLQFLLRNNKLDLICNMRSNDLLWGLCLDIPAFCFLQEVMAHWLNVEIGIYIHQPASLHYYIEFEKDLLSIESNSEMNNEIIPSWNIKYINTNKALKQFWNIEKMVREELKIEKTNFKVINEYLERLLKYWKNKQKVINS